MTREELVALIEAGDTTITIQDVLAAPTRDEILRAAFQTRRLIEWATPLFELTPTTTVGEITTLVDSVLEGIDDQL